MDRIIAKYNKSIETNDVARLKKKIKKIKDQKKPDEKKPTYEEGEDGWITVHHKRGADKRQTKNNKKKKEETEEKLVNFYAFEVKEAKLQKHKELLARFEEDKKKLQKMREQRKFKI